MEEMIYPIKYAVMPVTNYAIGDMIILGYVVSKVYIVNEYISYIKDYKKKSYDVVYPIKGLKSSEVMADLREPEFDQGNRCINCERNNDIFDTYEEAKKVCNEKNSELFHEDIINFTKRNDFIQDFEFKIMTKTNHLPTPEDLIQKNTR